MSNESERKQVDDAKTMAEHEAIILKYQKSGELDRDDAIKKYNIFNCTHPEYYATMMASATVSGSAAPIYTVPDRVVVGNLQAQLLYIIKKGVLEDKSNG